MKTKMLSAGKSGSSPFNDPFKYIQQASAWEYKVLTHKITAKKKSPTEKDLNALGEEGWELTGIHSGEEQIHFYFKRQLK